MNYGTLKDYVARMSLYPCYKTPKYEGKDEEFAHFTFRVPLLWRAISKDPENAEFVDKTGTLPDLWWLDMVMLPVYGSVELYKEDKIFMYFRCNVPIVLMKSPFGMGYFAPNMRFNNEVALPTPDHERAAAAIFDKMREKDMPKGQQYEVEFRCGCGSIQGEIYNSEDEAMKALQNRYCGSCHSMSLEITKFKSLWPEAKI